jgi:hypothetical protein
MKKYTKLARPPETLAPRALAASRGAGIIGGTGYGFQTTGQIGGAGYGFETTGQIGGAYGLEGTGIIGGGAVQGAGIAGDSASAAPLP